MIKAGDLRYRVVVQQKTTDSDTEGLITAGYSVVGSIWANIKPIGGEIAQRKYGIVDDGISMQSITRPNPIIAEQNVIVWNNKMYEIIYVAVFIDHYESLLKPVKA